VVNGGGLAGVQRILEEWGECYAGASDLTYDQVKAIGDHNLHSIKAMTTNPEILTGAKEFNSRVLS